MADESIRAALTVLAGAGTRLRHGLHLPWPHNIEQTVHRVRLDITVPSPPPIVGLFGGASSGKSTVFDNLLEGSLASRITARGHATVGPILAVHEGDRPSVERLLREDLLFPGWPPRVIELDADSTGVLDALSVVYHTVQTLRGVLVLDLPDFTSDAAAREGDIALALLPWFDRITMVLDSERWFDRQSSSVLRAQSLRVGQQRWVLFNQTRDGGLDEADRKTLADHAERLSATGLTVLEFRRGRGLCRFPPGTLDDVLTFLRSKPPERKPALLRCIGAAATEALNQNEERSARLRTLRESLRSVLTRTVPDRRACLLAIMTSSERAHLDVLSRVLRLGSARRWWSEQTRWLRSAVAKMPVVGSLTSRGVAEDDGTSEAATDRRALGVAVAERILRRHAHEVQRTVQGSAFWDELRRWTALEPTQATVAPPPTADVELAVETATLDIDDAIRAWNAKVESECQGLAPHLKGAIGVGTISLAIILIAVPGPLGALTLVAAKTAVVASLTNMIAAGGAGALFGRHLSRLTSVVQEKLLGSPEFDAVQRAADGFLLRIREACEGMSDAALAEASRLVLPSGDPVTEALEHVREVS